MGGREHERRLSVGSLTFNHWYEHTGRGLLGRVYASTFSGKPSTPDAVYGYPMLTYTPFFDRLDRELRYGFIRLRFAASAFFAW